MVWKHLTAVAAALGSHVPHLQASIPSPVPGMAATKCPQPDLCFDLGVPDTTLQSRTGDIFLRISGPAAYQSVTFAHFPQDSMLDTDWFATYNRTTWGRNFGRAMHDTKPELQPHTMLPMRSTKHGKWMAGFQYSVGDATSAGSMDFSVPLGTWYWGYAATNERMEELAHGLFHFDHFCHEDDLHALPDSDYTVLVGRAEPVGIGHAGHFGGPPKSIVRMAVAHGVLAGLAWAFIFPLGGIMIRLCSFRHLLWAHVALQILGLFVYTGAVALGIKLCLNPFHNWIENKHAVIGLVVYALFITQAASGYIHHIMFKKYISRTTWSHIHLWTGRLCITLAIINAGFGYQLRDQGMSSWKIILYTVCAVIMWSAYVCSLVYGEYRKKKETRDAFSALENGNHSATSSAGTPVVEQMAKQG